VKTKKVLHVIDSFDLGGAQTFLLEFTRNLDRSRFIAEVAAMHGHGVFESAFQEAGIVTHSLSPGKWPPLYLPNFLELMRRGKFDILHFHLFGANLCAKPLAILAGHPAIIVHDQCNDASREERRLLLAADALANRGASRVIAVSESVRRYLLDREGLDDEGVAMIPNGVDATTFHPPGDEERRAARLKMGLPEGNFVIGGVGRLVAQKNFSLFLEVAATVIKSHPEVNFLIAGSGPLEGELHRQVQALGLTGKVFFSGHVTDRLALFHALDALLMPSIFEGTPMTLLEAMASGLPVVASSVDGIGEVCTHGVDALLVRQGDGKGFLHALQRILDDDTLGKRLGANARQTILARYEIRMLTRKIEDLYTVVLQEY